MAPRPGPSPASGTVRLPSMFPSMLTPLSVLDLAPIPQGSNAADALHRSLDLAQHAERWGFKRFWLAEHHGMPGIASAATSVVMGHIAGGTSTIRVGAGGIMLPNHSPLVIAEQFGTLAALFPGRIDLGARPRTRHRPADRSRPPAEPARRPSRFRRMWLELMGYFRPAEAGAGGARGAGRRDSRCRSGSWAPACSGPSSPRRRGSRSPSPPTSPPRR